MSEVIYISTTRNDHIVYTNRVVLGDTVIARSAIVKLLWIEPSAYPGMLKIFYGNGYVAEIVLNKENKTDYMLFKESIEEILD